MVRREVLEGFEQRLCVLSGLSCCVYSSLEGSRGTHQGTSTTVQAGAVVLQPAVAGKEGRSACEKPA